MKSTFVSSIRRVPRAGRAGVTLFAAVVLAVNCPASQNNPAAQIDDASWKGDVDKVTALLRDNPELISSTDSNGWTPLHNAAYRGHKTMAELLLAKKANVNAKTKSGETPLHYAALHGFKDVVSLLVAARADVNAKSGDGETPLHLAAQYGDKDVVKLLMTSKIDVNAKDSDSQTALHDAAITGHKDVVELLVANRADVNAKDKNGETPLDCAVKYARADVAAFLRQHGGRNAIGAQPNAASKPKDVGSKDAYEVALFPEAYGFEKKAEMIDGTVVGREAYIGNQRMIIGVNKQWVKHNPGGRDMWLTVHFEQGKPAVAAWGGF